MTYLTKSSLEPILTKLFPNSLIEKEYSILLPGDKRAKKVNYFIQTNDNKIVVEFDGYRHFNNAKTILRDEMVKNYVESIEYNGIFISIPYFIQIDCRSIAYLFRDFITYDQAKALGFPEKSEYHHGFIDQQCLLPSDFSLLGYNKFIKFMLNFDKNIVNEINDSLVLKVKELIDSHYSYFKNIDIHIAVEFVFGSQFNYNKWMFNQICDKVYNLYHVENRL